MTSPVTPGERLDGVALERARRRAIWLLVAAAALGSIANVAAWTVIGLASPGSGMVVATIGFGALGLLGLALLGLATAVMLRMQRVLSPWPAPS